jgi:predicted nuclease of restriction endonuclease-like (RecB) superfamily
MAVEKKPAKATKFKGTRDAKATRGASPGVAPKALDFGALVTAIGQVHERCAIQAGKAVNIAVTVRNWAIGCYIREYEQHGSDRAAYGAKLLDSLARRLASARIVGLASRTLRQCRQFYVTYPGMWQALSAKSQGGLPLPGFWQTLSAELPMPTSITARALAKQRETPTPDLSVDPTRLVAHLSFSHFAELISIDDPLKRTFYEVEVMRGNWSVRELQRQIGALYFERSGLSKNPEKLAALVQTSAEAAEPQLSIRDPYVFEFLGLKSQEVMGESHLEDALLDKLQAFLIELGHGFNVPHRPIRDADFLGFGPQDAAVFGDSVRTICNIQADDGMVFEAGSIAIEEIREDTRYGGLRARLVGLLGKARSTCRMTL